MRLAGMLLCCAAALAAQVRHTPEQRFQMFERYLVARAQEVTAQALAGIDTLAGWQKKRPEVRRQLLFALGLEPMPARTPLRPRITGKLDRDAYTVEKLVFESMPGLYVTGNLYLPKGAAARLPAVLYLSGHAPGPWGAKVQYQHHGIWLARHGYVALLLDTVEFGEVPGIHHGTHDLGMWYWLSLGYTPAGPEVWNAIRALDYLETRPEVDPQRLAVTGISGGGAMTWYTTAVDERARVAAPVCASWTAGHHAALNAVHENCDCIYFVNTFLSDLPAVGALIAPRPLKILSAMRDPSFPRAGYQEVYRQVRRVYELYGAGDRVVEYEHDAPHQDIPAFRKEAYEWINRWLKQDSTPYEEGEIRREEPAELTVLAERPAGAINDQVHRTFIATARLREWKTRAAWEKRRSELLDRLRELVFRHPGAPAPCETWKAPEKGWTSRYADSFNIEFTSEPGVRIAGQLFLPRDGAGPHPALIYAKGAADVVYPVDYDLLLPALGNHVVLVLLPRTVDAAPGNYKLATLERTAALAGATIASMQVWDIRRAIDFLAQDQKLALSSVSVYGRREMGALALYAAALDERITRVILDDPPASHWQGPALLNVLRVTDLPEAAALVAPREIVSLTPLGAAWRYTAALYGLYGERLREARGLAAALGR